MDWLAVQAPQHAKRVTSRIEACRAGALNDSRFGHRMRGSGKYAEQIRNMFRLFAARYGLNQRLPDNRTDLFRPPRASNGQGRLF